MQIAGITPGSALGPGVGHGHLQHLASEESRRPGDVLDATSHDLKLEKSNILMLGPTGSGEE